ncbi:MAG: amino acid ABC transporter permease/ATP-binding protein [Propionibacteriaceae bacterium]|jgi:His/Glu/Gln/Arg/opine family amino acid ABC transporter permease subunit|nr:amino acid ABC transporter permease/ATP-binding protein [Propionibacteriaceae bacterium]
MDTLYNNFIAHGAWLTLLKGMGTTVAVTVAALIIGTLLGAVLCALARSRFTVLRGIAKTYIVLVRGTPVLLLLMLFYYVILAPLRTDALYVAFIAFGLNASAHIGELMRTALQGVSSGQVEAARSLGFSRWGAFRLVSFPQAARIARPVYENAIVNLLQWTSVVGYIALSDLTRVVNNMSSRTGQPFLALAAGIAFYLLLAGLVHVIFQFFDRPQTRRQNIAPPAPTDLAPRPEVESIASPNRPSPDSPTIVIDHLSQQFHGQPVLTNVSTTIQRGEVITVIGPSGAGKSTFLRALNWLNPPSSGQVIFLGQDLSDRQTDINLVRRKMGMVFQAFNLFSHLTVLDNCTVGPRRLLKLTPAAARQRAWKNLAAVGLAEKAGAWPDELSGGQQQRVAIARCLCMEPEIILFDEPTSALDPTMIGEVTAVIRQLAQTGLTMVIVTHEMEFARTVASRVFYLDDQTIYEDGPPEQIFANPQKPKTQSFINRVRSFEYDITSRQFDFIEMQNSITNFCVKHGVDEAKTDRILLLTEELVLNVLIPHIEQIDLTVSYSEKDQSYEIDATYGGPEFNPLAAAPESDSPPDLSVLIITGSADVSHRYSDQTNQIRLVVH